MEPIDAKEKNTGKKVQNEEVKEFLVHHLSAPKVFEISLFCRINSETPNTSRFISAIFVPPKV
jgi:hypothetical protein